MSLTSMQANITVVVAAFFLVVVTVIFTLYFSGSFSGEYEDDEGYQNITFTDAVLSCHENAQVKFGERIKHIETDDHSSRFDSKTLMYKIFLKMDLYKQNGELSELHFVNCFVRAGSGQIDKYEVLKDDEINQKSKDGTNMFGLPIKR